ncbi:hypothetical protein IWQ61_004643 [Dispira simplex]|nr:hypothetical protein IWQ61_004643 [Dispira simplex]
MLAQTLMTLPPDDLDKFVHYVGASGVQRIAATCHALRDLLKPYLFRSIYLGRLDDGSDFLWEVSLHYQRRVRTLSISFDGPLLEQHVRQVSNVLETLPYLRFLSLVGVHQIQAHYFWHWLAPFKDRLRGLEVWGSSTQPSRPSREILPLSLLADIPHLTHLGIGSFPGLTSMEVANILSHIPSLASLILRDPFNDEVLDFESWFFRKMRRLTLNITNMSSDQLYTLVGHGGGLREVTLYSLKEVNGRFLSQIGDSHWSNLRSLDLRGIRAGDTPLPQVYLHQFFSYNRRYLWSLQCKYIELDDPCLHLFATVNPQLRSVKLFACPITNEGVCRFLELAPQLEEFSLGTTTSGRLTTACLPQRLGSNRLRYLVLDIHRAFPDDFNSLTGQLHNLEKLVLPRSAELDKFEFLKSYCPWLELKYT